MGLFNQVFPVHTQLYSILWGCTSHAVLVAENLPANAGGLRDAGWILGLGRFPGGGHGNPFQYSCLEDPMGRGAWWAIVHRVKKGWT